MYEVIEPEKWKEIGVSQKNLSEGNQLFKLFCRPYY